MAKGDLVFCDVETTGLSWKYHRAIEISYMTQDMIEPVTVIPYMYRPDSRDLAYPWCDSNPKAMAINKFYNRHPAGTYGSTPADVKKMFDVMEGSTLVGANIRFDARMIENTFNLDTEPWHHRLFDLEAYAAGVFGWPKLKGWNEICDTIEKMSIIDHQNLARYPVFKNVSDHSAANDTQSVKDAYSWLVAFSADTGNFWTSIDEMGGE